jgi:hypothetical protein
MCFILRYINIMIATIRRSSFFLLLTASFLATTFHDAQSGTSIKDVLISVRTLIFLSNPPEGLSDFAVIYDPYIPESVKDKDAVYDAIDGGTPIGQTIIKTAPIPVSEIERINGYKYLLITTGMDRFIPQIQKMVQGKGIVTISTDLRFVTSGQCVLGVTSEPNIRVLLNRAAAKDAAVAFSTSFRMMIQEM